MKRAFTIIEVVFVIIIIGILAAIALPKFLILTDDAHVSKLQSFVGTLNRTVAPSMWSGIQRNYPAANGSVKYAGLPPKLDTIIGSETTVDDNEDFAQVEVVPSELTTGVTNGAEIELSVNCLDANATVEATSTGIASGVVAGTTYTVICKDGSLDVSPHFYLSDGSNIITK